MTARALAFSFRESASIATSAVAAERFATDKPSPLRRVKGTDLPRVRFNGQVQLSGDFLVIWELIGGKPRYQRVMFFPDHGSSALLPRPAGSGPVTMLLLSNLEQAAPMLRDLAGAPLPLPQRQHGAAGTATIAIRDYQMTVECDQRWYGAKLISARATPLVVAKARDGALAGC